MAINQRSIAAQLHEANHRIITASRIITTPADDPNDALAEVTQNLSEASNMVKEVIGKLMEGQEDYYGNRVPLRDETGHATEAAINAAMDAGERSQGYHSADGYPIKVGARFWNNDLRVCQITEVAVSSNDWPDSPDRQTWHQTERGRFDTFTGHMRQYGRLARFYNGTDAERFEPGTTYRETAR